MQIRNVPEKELESYQNEVRLLSELEHPGIVEHVESFIDADKAHMCIVMAFCEGGDLAAYLKHKKGVPMREGEVLYHFVQMALALLFMHEKNILHRDLKTQNVRHSCNRQSEPAATAQNALLMSSRCCMHGLPWPGISDLHQEWFDSAGRLRYLESADWLE